jgi:tRNA threonylcarbamoyladenosine biosynthesis protein TsaE
MDFVSKNAKDTQEFARGISSKIKPNDVLALYGDLGAGKTTFVRYLTEALKIPSRVQSPTFVIIRKYIGGTSLIKAVNHIDLYRLTDIEEIKDLGIEDLINEPGSATVIEWPELMEAELPKDTIKIRFQIVNEAERKIHVQNLD